MKNCPAFRVSLTAIDTYARIRVNPVTPLCKIGACFNDYFSGNRCTRSCSLRILHTPPINFSQKEIASIECHEVKAVSKYISNYNPLSHRSALKDVMFIIFVTDYQRARGYEVEK